MKTFFAEFKKFITRGNIVDMSVGVIVGGAFTSIVNALSNNILKPVINWILAMLLGTDSLSGIFTYLKRVDTLDAEGNKVLDAAGEPIADLTQSIYIDWGAFINAIINFLIIAFVLFCIVKLINTIAESSARIQDKKAMILLKKEKGWKLSKKEVRFLEEEERKEKELEAKRIAEEEALKNAPKPVTSEDLLTEIRDLLKNK